MKHIIALVVVVAAGGTAFAQPEDAPAPATATQSEWYGWQILAADAGAFGLAAASRQGEIALAWVGTGPAIHAAHDHPGRAVASVALRVGLPILGFAVGANSARDCSGDFCDLGPALAGGLIGMGAAEVADLVMATDEHEVAPPRRSWTPVARVRSSGGTVGIAGRF